MANGSSLFSPSVIEMFFFHKNTGEEAGKLETFKDLIDEKRGELEGKTSIKHVGERLDLVCNVEILEGSKYLGKLKDFYFVLVIIGFEKDNKKIKLPFPPSEDSIFVKLESKCSEICNKLPKKLKEQSYGRNRLISSKTTEEIDRPLIKDRIFAEDFLKGDTFGEALIYRSVNEKNRYFLNILVKNAKDKKTENEILRSFAKILAYYGKINLFYDQFYGNETDICFKDFSEAEKNKINCILEDVKEKLKNGEENISATELGEKNSEISSAISELAELNYRISEQVDSIEFDIFNMRSYMDRLDNRKIDGLSSFFKEMEKKGEAALHSYRDVLEDLRDLQNYLKLDSDIIQNHLEVEESRFNNRIQIAAYIVGFAMLFEAIIESFVYILNPSSFYSFTPLTRLLFTIIFFAPLVILALLYSTWKKGRLSVED